jgi:transglutaminase-like putative cysteine protease
MNAGAAAALSRRAPVARRPRRVALRAPRVPTPALVAFGALAALSGLRFAALLAHPPVLGVLGVAATGACEGVALAYTRTLPRRAGLATLARVAILALAAYVALRLVGVPARLLWPWRWHALARFIGHGLDALNGLWPYRGDGARARTAVMLPVAASVVAAATVAFWPGARRARARQAPALALLLGVYVLAAINQSQTGWQFQGVLMLALLCVWGWAWRERPIDGARASAWMLAAAALALVAASTLRSGTPALDVRAWNPFGPSFPAIAFDWSQTYGPLATDRSSEIVVSVDSPATHLWRATTLDSFDGVGFVRSREQPGAGDGLADAADLAAHPRWIARATVTVRGLSSAQLLSPGQPLRASLVGEGSARLAPTAADGTLSVAGAPPASGERYTVTAYAPRPTVAQLARASSAFPASYLPYTEFDVPNSGGVPVLVSATSAAGVRRIESSPYAGVYALARSLAAGAPGAAGAGGSGTGSPGAYGVVARIQAFLHHGFAYDEDPPPSPYPLVSFLLSQRFGYCQQFSGAMTLLLRMDGIPARVAAGFLPGTRDPGASAFEVSAREAHEWVEVYFSGIGWVPFDPTPAAPRAGSATAASFSALAGAPRPIVRHRSGPPRSSPADRDTARATGTSGAGNGDELAIGLAAVAVALALALGGIWRLAAARAEASLAGDASGAVRELSRALPRFGVPLAADTTLAELERRLQRSHGPGASRYVRLLRERRYGADADPHRPTARDRRLLRRALCAHRGPLARLRALIALPPGAR